MRACKYCGNKFDGKPTCVGKCGIKNKEHSTLDDFFSELDKLPPVTDEEFEVLMSIRDPKLDRRFRELLIEGDKDKIKDFIHGDGWKPYITEEEFPDEESMRAAVEIMHKSIDKFF